MMDITVRLAAAHDAKELKRLNDMFNGCDANTTEGVEMALLRMDTETVFVAQAGDALIGFLCAQLLKSICYSVFYVEITELFVEEAYRKQGAGRALIQAAENHYREKGIHDFQLFTGGENENAQQFYQRMGYRRNDDILFRKRDSWE